MGDVFEFTLSFGWSAPSIEEQLTSFGVDGVPEKKLKAWQKAADGILACAMQDFMTDSEAMKSRNRMARKVEAWLSREGFLVPAEQSND